MSVILQPLTTPAGTSMANAVLKGDVITAGEVHDLAAPGGDYVYGCGANGTFEIYNVSNPDSPTMIGSYSSATNLAGGDSLDANGRYVYVSAYTNHRLTAVDVSNPKVPSLGGTITDATNLKTASGVKVSGRYAVVAGDGVVSIVDVKDPANMRILGTVSDATKLGGAKDVRIQGKYAYIAGTTSNYLSIIDFSNPASPTIVGSIQDTTYGIDRLEVQGRYAYTIATGGSPQMATWDLLDPTTPVLANRFIDGGIDKPLRIVAAGNCMVITTQSDEGLLVLVDITNPLAPSIPAIVIQDIPFEGAPAGELSHIYGAAFDGRYLYTSNFTMTIVDLVGDVGADDARHIGSLNVGKLNIRKELSVDGSARIRTGLSVGTNGVKSDGPIVTNHIIATKADTTGNRITATVAGPGATMFDTTLGKPIWSNGTNWLDATGVIV